MFAADGLLEYTNEAALPLWAAAHASGTPSPLDAIVGRGLLAGEVSRDVVIGCGGHFGSDGEWQRPCDIVVNAIPLHAATDGVNGLLMTMEDVTVRRETERLRPMLETLGRL